MPSASLFLTHPYRLPEAALQRGGRIHRGNLRADASCQIEQHPRPVFPKSPDMSAPCFRSALIGIRAETGFPVSLWPTAAQGVAPHPAGTDCVPDMGRFPRGFL